MKHRSSVVPSLLVLVALAGCGGSDAADLRSEDDVSLAAPPMAPVGGGEDTVAAEPPGTELPGATPSAGQPGGDGDADRSPPADVPRTPAPSRAPVAAQPEAAGTQANDILRRAERAYAQIRSLEADFVQDVYVPLLDSTQRSRGKIFHRSPDRFRMQFSDPQGDLIVADGQYVWMYYPSNDPEQVLRSRLAAGGQQFDLHREFLSDASERYNATRTGMESVAGRQAHALTLIPRGASPYTRVRIWVDAEDSLVRRFEIVEQNETARMLNLSNLRPNVSLADNLFRFTPPPRATVYDP